MSLPVNARVSEKLRGKIWKDEFIDFGCLLANPVLANRFQLTVQNAASGPLPSLCIEPIAKNKKIISIESWLSSFHTFVGIYTKRFPHEAPALMNIVIPFRTWQVGAKIGNSMAKIFAS